MYKDQDDNKYDLMEKILDEWDFAHHLAEEDQVEIQFSSEPW